MNNFDKQQYDSTVSKDDSALGELHSAENFEANETAYGIIYTPSDNGNDYVGRHYDIKNVEDYDDCESHIEQKRKKKSTNAKRLIVGISLALVLAVLVAGASAFSAVWFTSKYYEEMLDASTLQQTEKKDPKQNNDVYIDKHPPEYMTQTKSPGEVMTMEEAIAAVKDSVVEITTEKVQKGFGSYSQYVVSGAGSGVIISTGGYIITNNHVIENASNIIVRLTNGKEYVANLVATDSKTDVAVISITPQKGDSLVSATIGSSDSLVLGQTVIAIGNPMGMLGGTVSDGIISCLAREIAIDGSGTMSLLQTNAAVSPGNSGGGLFDLYGRLIGVVNAKSTGEGVEGISFAIPIDTAWDVAQQLIDKGYVSGRPSLGVELKQVQYGSSIFGEVYYNLVVSDADESSGFEINDIIYSIDEYKVTTLADISDILASKAIGDKVNIVVVRNRRYIEIEVTLIEYIP